MRRLSDSPKHGERGSVLAISAFGMLAFLLAVGLSVDVSHFYLVKTELKNAADAAALAGASALDSSPGGIAEATERATQTMNSFEFNNNGVLIDDDDVTFSATLDSGYMSAAAASAPLVAPTIRFVKVSVPPKTVNVFFASIVIGNTKDLTAESVAGMSVPLNVIFSFIPLSIVQDSAAPLTPGQLYTARGGPHSSVSPGNYQVLAVDGRGADEAREGIARGVYRPTRVGDTFVVDTEPGINAGPVRQGINTRFGDYSSGLDPTQHPPDTNVMEHISYSEYQSRQPGYTQPSSYPDLAVEGRRIVIIPIVNHSEYDPGRNEVRFARFGLFFLRSRVSEGSGGDLEVEYIGTPASIGARGFDPSAGPGDPLLTMPVIYR
jgi:Flp pilus assembly protein TadG